MTLRQVCLKNQVCAQLLPTLIQLISNVCVSFCDSHSCLNSIQMTHRLEWISAEWMHELTFEQFKPTSAASGF